MRTIILATVIAMSLGWAFECAPATAKAGAKKTWTITDRQVELRKKVGAGVKSKELTAKEADKLNNSLDDVDKDINKMKSKNGGKLSYKDEGKIEKKLNGISLKLDKYSLEKRVQAH